MGWWSIPVSGISIHAPRAGARQASFTAWAMCRLIFQSTRPVRGRDLSRPSGYDCKQYFNPRAPCGGATSTSEASNPRMFISIHAPRAGARQAMCNRRAANNIFQSTRPVRGRDYPLIRCKRLYAIFQSTRPVRGRDLQTSIRGGNAEISIHAPRAGARQQKYTKLLYTLLRQKAIFR